MTDISEQLLFEELREHIDAVRTFHLAALTYAAALEEILDNVRASATHELNALLASTRVIQTMNFDAASLQETLRATRCLGAAGDLVSPDGAICRDAIRKALNHLERALEGDGDPLETGLNAHHNLAHWIGMAGMRGHDPELDEHINRVLGYGPDHPKE